MTADRRLTHCYGPTEATTFGITFSADRANALPPSLPIGRPIANTQAYVLDASLLPVPIGATGELYVAGAGLARCYLNDPRLTAEKFLPNPHGAMPGSRMYRTGDSARYRPDGTIEFLGRLDDQVKLRGFRIELGEVEAALAALPGVRASVVMAREDRPGDKRLVGYVVPAPELLEFDAAALRGALGHMLPDYMVPSHLVVLDALPLTANGKLDRKALPAPDPIRYEADYVAPRSATEATVASIWSEILGVNRVGAHDDFFELGGHSLLATQAASKLRATLAVDIPLRALFALPTVAALAAWIDGVRPASDAARATAGAVGEWEEEYL